MYIICKICGAVSQVNVDISHTRKQLFLFSSSSAGIGTMEVQIDTFSDVADVDNVLLAGNQSWIYDQRRDVKKYPDDDWVREFAGFAACKVAIMFYPHGEGVLRPTKANTR